MTKFSLSRTTYEARVEKIREKLSKRNLDALYLSSAINIFYVSGFFHIPTERPIVLVIPSNGEIFCIAPSLEQDNIEQKVPFVRDFSFYFEYPGKTHPMSHIAKTLKKRGFDKKRIGIDYFAAATWGYKGPALTEKLTSLRCVDAKDMIDNMRIIKTEEEIDLIKESAKWGNLAHAYLQEYIEPGKLEMEVSLQASFEASKALIKTLGSEYGELRWGRNPIFAGVKGGPQTGFAHPLSPNRKLRQGDILMSFSRGAVIGGYDSELERTMFLGQPDKRQEKLFQTALEAQTLALEALKPGVRCCDVDKIAMNAIKEAGYSKLIRHRTGHGLGLEAHEPPWIDEGDASVLKEGMVVTCEPALYISGYGGFRHSDTAIITEDGADITTYYPRDIESLTIRRY